MQPPGQQRTRNERRGTCKIATVARAAPGVSTLSAANTGVNPKRAYRRGRGRFRRGTGWSAWLLSSRPGQSKSLSVHTLLVNCDSDRARPDSALQPELLWLRFNPVAGHAVQRPSESQTARGMRQHRDLRRLGGCGQTGQPCRIRFRPGQRHGSRSRRTKALVAVPTTARVACVPEVRLSAVCRAAASRMLWSPWR